MIVVDHKRGGTEYVWKNLLTKLEEEEFDTGEEMKVKFTTLNHLLETVTTGKLPLDMWGDTIERGPRASVFYKDIMFVIPNNNDDIIDNDFITRNWGLVFNDQLVESMRKEDEDIQSSLSRIIYIVTDETVQQTITYINNNPLLLDFTKKNDWVFANSIWAKACVDTNEKCEPDDHPQLFQPQECPSAKGPCLDKLVISVSGYSEYHVEHQGIILWIEKLGGTYTESLSADSTHLIAHHSNSDCKKALGSVHQVSIRWLYDVMQNGYKGYEERYQVPITITITEKSGKGRDIYVLPETTPISEVLRIYADAEQAKCGVSQYNFFWQNSQIVNHDSTLTELCLNDGDELTAEINTDVIRVIIQDGLGSLYYSMNLYRRNTLSELFEHYAETRGIELSSYEFYFKDEMIKNLTDTPITLGLCDDGIIKVMPVPTVTVRIRDMDSRNESMFNVKKKTRVENIFQEYADREDVYLSNLVFYLNGEKIDDYNATPITLKLEDDDQIDVIVDCRSSSPSIDCGIDSAQHS